MPFLDLVGLGLHSYFSFCSWFQDKWNASFSKTVLLCWCLNIRTAGTWWSMFEWTAVHRDRTVTRAFMDRARECFPWSHCAAALLLHSYYRVGGYRPPKRAELLWRPIRVSNKVINEIILHNSLLCEYLNSDICVIQTSVTQRVEIYLKF